MSKILGLDISTSVTGVALVEKVDDVITPLALEHIEFKKCKTLWEKVDVVKAFFDAFFSDPKQVPDAFFVEESLMGFRTGMSSAATITTLAKFNGLVSYTVRNMLGIDPNFVAATSARKRCGIKVQKTSECGKNGKQQTFEWVMAGPLKDHAWPTKKNGDPKDWAKDVTDAYVIARAGSLIFTGEVIEHVSKDNHHPERNKDGARRRRGTKASS